MTPEQKANGRENLWNKVCFYAGPYSIFHSRKLGRGFCFLQSPNSISQIEWPLVVFSVFMQTSQQNESDDSSNQQKALRSVFIHFLTLGEFNSDLCRDDFKLAAIRDELSKAVNEYDPKKELVVLMRFQCGHIALGVIKQLVPDYGICLRLGEDYYAETDTNALQLNLDQM